MDDVICRIYRGGEITLLWFPKYFNFILILNFCGINFKKAWKLRKMIVESVKLILKNFIDYFINEKW